MNKSCNYPFFIGLLKLVPRHLDPFKIANYRLFVSKRNHRVFMDGIRIFVVISGRRPQLHELDYHALTSHTVK
jgi:hypothetical protein